MWNQIAYKLTFEHCNVRESVSPFQLNIAIFHFQFHSLPYTLCHSKCVRGYKFHTLPCKVCKATHTFPGAPLHTLPCKVWKGIQVLHFARGSVEATTEQTVELKMENRNVRRLAVKRIRVHCNVRRLACTQSDSTLPLRSVDGRLPLSRRPGSRADIGPSCGRVICLHVCGGQQGGTPPFHSLLCKLWKGGVPMAIRHS